MLWEYYLIRLHFEHSGKVYLIDFEYGSYNYRGFDIGNHFNEYAGYECDYSLYVITARLIFLCNLVLKIIHLVIGHLICRYPDKDEQYHFLKHYLDPYKPDEV